MRLFLIENRYGQTVEFIAQREGGWGVGPGRRPGGGSQVERDPPVSVPPGDHALAGAGIEIPLYMVSEQGQTGDGFDGAASFADNRMFFRLAGQDLWSFSIFDNLTIIGADGADFQARSAVRTVGKAPVANVVVTLAADGLSVREATLIDLMRRRGLLGQ